MKLTYEQIKSITQGAVKITEENGLINFFRFTDEEQKMYEGTDFYRKTFSTSGVQLNFKTDGDAINLKIETSPSTSRTFFSLDIFADGKLVDSCTNFNDKDLSEDYLSAQFPQGAFTNKTKLDSGDKIIRIVFPWSVATKLTELEIENATYIEPVKKDRKLVIYGDSITQGYDALYCSNSYATKLGELLNAEIYNKAIGGEVFFPELAKGNNGNPDYVFVADGTNDFSLREFDDFKDRCSRFFSNLTDNYKNSKIFAITPIWRADFDGPRKFGDFFNVFNTISELCSKYDNITVISGWDLVKHDINCYSDLRLHPNDEGFKHYSKNLGEILGVLI